MTPTEGKDSGSSDLRKTFNLTKLLSFFLFLFFLSHTFFFNCCYTSSKQQTKQKYKPNHQQTGLPPHSALPIRGKTNKQIRICTNLTLYKAYTNHWTKLRRAEIKRKKELNLEAWEKETLNTVSLKKMKRQRNTTQMREQTRKPEVQINEEEIGKLPEKEFRKMIVKMIKNLENKMEKMQKSINKDLE